MNQVKGEKHSLMVLLVLFIGYTSVYVDKYTIGISLVTVSQDLGFDPSQKGVDFKCLLSWLHAFSNSNGVFK